MEIVGGSHMGSSGVVVSKDIGSMVKVKLNSSQKRSQPVLVSVANLRLIPDSCVLVKPPETAPVVFRQRVRQSNDHREAPDGQMATSRVLSDLTPVAKIVQTFASSSTQTEPDALEPVVIRVGSSSSTSTQTVHPGGMTARFATTIKKMSISSMCMCLGKGKGKFIECKSESLCEGNRFYHITCVNISETDYMVFAIQKKFMCVLCTSTQAAGNKRVGSSDSVRYITESAPVSLSGMIVTASTRPPICRDPYKCYMGSGNGKSTQVRFAQTSISPRQAASSRPMPRYQLPSKTLRLGNRQQSLIQGVSFVSSLEASGESQQPIDSSSSTVSRTVLSSFLNEGNTREDELSQDSDSHEYSQSNLLEQPCMDNLTEKRLESTSTECRDVNCTPDSTTVLEDGRHQIPHAADFMKQRSEFDGKVQSSWQLMEQPSKYLVLPPCPKIMLPCIEFSDTSHDKFAPHEINRTGIPFNSELPQKRQRLE